MVLDILIKNGRVYDTSANMDEVKSIGVKGNKIVDITKLNESELKAERVIDANGCYVFPGLIDFHAHVFYNGAPICVEPNSAFLPNGVTSVVDAGSAGWGNYRSFYNSIITPSVVRIKSYLNVVNVGLATLGGGPTGYLENIDPKNFNRDKIIQTFEEYKHNLIGLKLRFSKDLLEDRNLYMEPLIETIKIAEEIGCPICVHTTDPVIDAGELAEYFRPGDIYAHIYHGVGNIALDKDGKVLDKIKDARERGVIFDSSNGVAHFDFDVAYKAIEDGFLPDVISTDCTCKNCYNPSKVVNLPFIMSKYLNMGLSMKDIMKAVTTTPAKIMGLEGEIGTLAPGAAADVSIFKIIDKETIFEDTVGKTMVGKQLFKNQLTVRNGVVVFRQIDF